jgi:hypothetical protein
VTIRKELPGFLAVGGESLGRLSRSSAQSAKGFVSYMRICDPSYRISSEIVGPATASAVAPAGHKQAAGESRLVGRGVPSAVHSLFSLSAPAGLRGPLELAIVIGHRHWPSSLAVGAGRPAHACVDNVASSGDVKSLPNRKRGHGTRRSDVTSRVDRRFLRGTRSVFNPALSLLRSPSASESDSSAIADGQNLNYSGDR